MSFVTRLTLTQFRSYAGLDLTIDAPLVALSGENGAGKTNILEALSLFTPGRGLRRADLADMARQEGNGEGNGSFGVAIAIDGEAGEHRLGTGLEATGTDARAARLCRVDGAPAPSPAAFADLIRLVWLTPDLDGLFRGSAGERRRFLDRLVLAIDSGHGGRVNALERALRSRNKILDESFGNKPWLDAIEREVAEYGVAVAAARAEAVTRLSALIMAARDDESPFPWAALALEGDIDTIVATHAAVDSEDIYRAMLAENRPRDMAAGRTLAGPQASDLSVRHGPKGIEAALASTGEQKALLVGLVLSHARLVASMSGIAPVVLLDEIAAHLDPRRRAALYQTLGELGAQVWMTGADAALFDDLPAHASLFNIVPGRAERLR